MSVESDLAAGLIGLIEGAGIAVQGASTGTSIVAKALNPMPDRGIAITIGGVGDSASQTTGSRTVRFAFRGTTDTRDVDELAGTVFDLLQGAHGLYFGDTALTHLYRMSFTSLGRDDPGRWERSDNYLADISTAATELRPN